MPSACDVRPLVRPLDAFLLPSIGGVGFGVVVSVRDGLCFVRMQSGVEGTISEPVMRDLRDALTKHCRGDAC